MARYLHRCDDGTYDIKKDGETIHENVPECVITAAPEMLAALERLVSAAFRRDTTMGDACRLIEVKAELDSASKQGCAAIATAIGK